MTPRLAIIAGPTAVGKSEIAHRLALDLDGELVNADSIQIYRGMDIGSGKPGPDYRAQRTYHLLDVREPNEHFDAAVFRDLASRAIHEATLRGKIPIMVGGTGFYIRSLLYGLSAGGGRRSEVRRRWEARIREEGADTVHRELQEVDPAAASRIHPHDRVRIIRAMEVWETTRRPISAWWEEQGPRTPAFDFLLFVLNLDRPDLNDRISKRVDHMIEKGWMEEVARLIARGHDESCRPMGSIGYRQLVQVHRGGLSLTDAAISIKKKTIDYAKRQLTWFRKEAQTHWVSPGSYSWIRDQVSALSSKPAAGSAAAS